MEHFKPILDIDILILLSDQLDPWHYSASLTAFTLAGLNVHFPRTTGNFLTALNPSYVA